MIQESSFLMKLTMEGSFECDTQLKGVVLLHGKLMCETIC
jgi:hypothetical protein